MLASKLQNLVERGNLLSHELPVIPHPRVQLPQLRQRVIPHRSLAVRGAFQSFVVNGHEPCVPGEMKVGLDELGAERYRPLKRGQRILGGTAGGAAMRNDPRGSHDVRSSYQIRPEPRSVPLAGL